MRSILLVLLVLGGCVGYSTYPPVDGQLARSETNLSSVYGVCIGGLQYITRRYPPDTSTEFAINIPPGIKRTAYQSIATRIGPNARPLTPETEDLPIYHVPRVWIRGTRAKVDILRPLTEIGPDGLRSYQPITLDLKAAVGGWTVTQARVRAVGTVATPDPYYLPPETPEEPLMPVEGTSGGDE